MTSKKLATVVIDLSDVVAAGGVQEAIHAFCEKSDSVSSGVVGSEFSTSGPGAGWSTTHGVSDFACRAFEGGALYYCDATDGRVASAVAVYRDADGDYWTSEGEDADSVSEDDVTYDGSGGYVLTTPEWSAESEVYVECPIIEDALEHPEAAAEMARSVIDSHHALSDVAEWKRLVKAIQDAAEEFESIDADDFADAE